MNINWFDVTGDKSMNPEDDVIVFFYTDRGELRLGKYRRSLDGVWINGKVESGWTSEGDKFYGKVIKWRYIETPKLPLETELEKLLHKIGEHENMKATIDNLRLCIRWLSYKHPTVFIEMAEEFDTVNLKDMGAPELTVKGE